MVTSDSQPNRCTTPPPIVHCPAHHTLGTLEARQLTGWLELLLKHHMQPFSLFYFGSFLYGITLPGSDVDICIELQLQNVTLAQYVAAVPQSSASVSLCANPCQRRALVVC